VRSEVADGETSTMAGKTACRVVPWCDLRIEQPVYFNVNYVG